MQKPVEPEILTRDANDREIRSAQPDGFSGNRRILAKLGFPKRMGQDDQRRLRFIASKSPPQRGRHAQNIKVIHGDGQPHPYLCVSSYGGQDLAMRGHSRNRPRGFAEVVKVGIGDQAVSLLRGCRVDPDDSMGIPNRQGPEQNRIRNARQRGDQGDSGRHRRDGQPGHSPVFRKRAHGSMHVVSCCLRSWLWTVLCARQTGWNTRLPVVIFA
jgi:hypothetical protein